MKPGMSLEAQECRLFVLANQKKYIPLKEAFEKWELILWIIDVGIFDRGAWAYPKLGMH